ncbi:arsenical pump membrane protein [Colletotrichum spaethianum]|uniref:Arsenical pump membrane protein n=1 Tax=Colletotrichum spaethianum TaxID=700344 RepID=A0AA37P9Q3_9PEZI|nr:arsenical pump membrane protein [Colletotrichum spaethianum]GKT48234.1 arsenical pump membrane protein [Colletotrichum spaethianum]
METSTGISTETSQIKEWRSIVTLIVFFLAILFPFKVPIHVPVRVVHKTLDGLSALRVIPPREKDYHYEPQNGQAAGRRRFVPLLFPVNSVTAPLIADLFLLAILAIGRKEVHDGTLGDNGIFPIDIMVFFITLAYIAISIDASGLIRYLALKVLQWGGEVGHRLFFYLYAFFFCLGSFIGNDPIILSGTAFLAYMTRVSTNIKHPKAWIFTQFAIANISSAILVSSNPTNLVLAGAFGIKFIVYTANMVVPVVVTAIVLFPFLLYVVFNNEGLIPYSIKMREAPRKTNSKPVNPNIPSARGNARDENVEDENTEQLIEEIMNPWLDKGGAAFGAVIMSVTLVTVLAINAASVKTKNDEHFQVFWVTLPAAFVMLCWDLWFGWLRREETRAIAKGVHNEGDRSEHVDVEHGEERSRASETEMAIMTPACSSPNWPHIHVETAEDENDKEKMQVEDDDVSPVNRDIGVETSDSSGPPVVTLTPAVHASEDSGTATTGSSPQLMSSATTAVSGAQQPDAEGVSTSEHKPSHEIPPPAVSDVSPQGPPVSPSMGLVDDEKRREDAGESRTLSQESPGVHAQPRWTLVSRCRDGYRWLQETFPTVMAVISHLPFALVPFAFAMFVLVQALVTKGWVPVFAYGWDHWVEKTGTIGAIGGMGFLSVILCNFAGTNIGTTILLSRVVQAWMQIRRENGVDISDRMFWGTVYSMALGVNYGAFSTAFSASLAGLLWRDILGRKHIHIRRMEFARENVPIITIAMIVGCTVLVGEIYIIRKDTPYHL